MKFMISDMVHCKSNGIEINGRIIDIRKSMIGGDHMLFLVKADNGERAWYRENEMEFLLQKKPVLPSSPVVKNTVEVPIDLIKLVIELLEEKGFKGSIYENLKYCMPKPPLTNEELIESLEKSTLIVNCYEWNEIKKRLREANND